MKQTIKLSCVDKTNVGDLAFLLANDNILVQSLDPTKQICALTGKELFEDLQKWQDNNNAISYAILLNGKSIGLISLSHQKGSCARVGYWVASAEWNKGHTTKAFKQIVEIAKKRGFKKLSASIDSNNIASRRIWEKYGGNFIECEDKLNVSLAI